MHPDYGKYPDNLSDLIDAVGPEEWSHVHILTAAENHAYAHASVERLVDPRSSGALDWSKTTVLEQYYEQEYEAESARLAELTLRYVPSPETEVIVFWANLTTPTVKMPARIAADNSGELMDADFDAWIFLPEKGVLIEYWHSGRITAGKVPERNEDG